MVKGRIPDERPLSKEEIHLLEWLLANDSVSEYKSQIPKLRVATRCGCGCPSVDFATGSVPHDGPSRIIADAEGYSSEGSRVGAILLAREGEISELEIYSCTGEMKFTLPKPESLVRWPEWPAGWIKN